MKSHHHHHHHHHHYHYRYHHHHHNHDLHTRKPQGVTQDKTNAIHHQDDKLHEVAVEIGAKALEALLQPAVQSGSCSIM
jgi:hypothetical protein